MTATTHAPYEAMFLISQGEAVDLAGVVDHILDVLRRHGAELIAMKKWDERRLAYEIDKQRRGVYILAYFYADGSVMHAIERDFNLSERILRQLMLRADHLSEDQMRAADAREELAAEAKLRAERALDRDGAESGVKLGRAGQDEADQGEPQADDTEAATEE